MFTNFEKIFYQIKNKLLDSPDFKKLVFYNTPDALSRPEPSFEESSQSVYIKPIIYVYDDSPEYGISTFVSIGLIESMVFDGFLSSSIKVSVACDRTIWEMDNYKVRPLAILSEIAKLDEVKLDVAGKLSLKVIKEVYYNNDLVGYTALFDINEEKGDVVNEF